MEELRTNPRFSYLIQANKLPSEASLRHRLDELRKDSTLSLKLFEVSKRAIKSSATLPVRSQINQKVYDPGKETRQNFLQPLK